MVRNLMMVFGLSLAVAAFGCSDDEGVPGACTNAADTELVCADGFDESVGVCAGTALGQGPGTSTCLQGDPGLSAGCADCYGDITQCGFDNCVTLCGTAPDGQPCRDCVSENCDAAFESCTGAVDCGTGGSGGAGGAGGAGGGAGGGNG